MVPESRPSHSPSTRRSIQARAKDVSNYGEFVITAGPGGIFGTVADDSTPIRSAVYNPSNLTVTVTPAGVLPMTRLNRIVIYGRANPLLNTGVVNTNGNLLAGSNGVSGTPFVTIFGAGTRLTYPDGTGNSVTLRLARGGLMELFQAPNGQIQQLALIGTVPNRSTLTGTVRRGPHGSGRTAMPPITGGAGVRIRLKPPAFGSPKAATIPRPRRTPNTSFGSCTPSRNRLGPSRVNDGVGGAFLGRRSNPPRLERRVQTQPHDWIRFISLNRRVSFATGGAGQIPGVASGKLRDSCMIARAR